MTDTTLGEVLRKSFVSLMADVHVSLPATILEYEPSTQKAKVKPSIKQAYADDREDSMPDISNVPVIFPSSADGGLSFPLKSGDGVLLVFSERALEEWVDNGGEVSPGDPRTFDLTDAIAIAGLESFAKTRSKNSDSDAVFYLGEAILRLQGDGKLAIGSNGVELLQLLSDLLQALLDARTPTAIGLQPLISSLPAFTALKAQVDSIKGSL